MQAIIIRYAYDNDKYTTTARIVVIKIIVVAAVAVDLAIEQ